MEDSWVNEWREKVKKMRFMWLKVFLISIPILSIFWAWYGYYNSIFCFVIAIVASLVCYVAFNGVIISLFIRLKTRIIGESMICCYAGAFTNILIIDGKEYDRCFMHNDYLYGQLPDGRQVCVKK